MIIFLRSFFFIALMFACLTSNAQQPSLAKADTVSKKDSLYKVLFNRRGKSIFTEFFGPGGVYSLNYDIRLKKKQNGIGTRVGLSYFANSYGRAFTVPVMLNYLIGKRSHYIEIGAGATFYHFESDDPYKRFFTRVIVIPYEADPSDPPSKNGTNENGAIFSVSAGYRYQPLKGGITCRIGLSPVFNTERIVPIWPYASIGYAFKHKVKPKETLLVK